MKKEKKYFYYAIFIALGAFFCRVWGLFGGDLHHDAAINSYRSFGWFDYLTSQGQTSPISWFGYIPWWANLSFHDHPFLTFLIQRIFFTVLPKSTVTALLPFALAGSLVTFLIYLIVRKYRSQNQAILASALFAFSSYAIWIGRIGYLEGLEILFITSAIYSFLEFLRTQKSRYLYFWWGSVALAIACKYTAIFLLPAGIIYLLIYQRKIFTSQRFWFGFLIFLIILSPIIIYNGFVFYYRGHFDAAFSSMVGMHPTDYEIISSRGVDKNIISNLVVFGKSIFENSSFGFGLINIFAIVYLFGYLLFKKRDQFNSYLSLNILLMVVMFSFANLASRFVSIITPFLALMVAEMIFSLAELLKNQKAVFSILVFFFGAIFCWEAIYAINSNILSKPLGGAYFYYPSRPYNLGFSQLEDYMKENVYDKYLEKRKMTEMSSIAQISVGGKEVVLFDERTDWFSRMWHVDLYQTYYGQPILFFTDISLMLPPGETNYLAFLAQKGATGFWFVRAVNKALVETENETYNISIDSLMEMINSAGLKPKQIIYDYEGQPSFEIYNFGVN